MLLKVEKDKKTVQDKLAAGESPVTAVDYRLYQVRSLPRPARALPFARLSDLRGNLANL